MRLHYDDEESDENENFRFQVVTDPEEWQDHYSEELVQSWHLLTDWLSARGLAVLDRATFHAFATFCFEYSSGVRPRV